MRLLKTTIISAIFICLLIATAVQADVNDMRWNSQRDYEPVVMTGSAISGFLGENVGHIFCYAYHADDEKWVQIPFQIDEKDDSSHVWVPSPNNVLDANDEILFMAGDMGDRTPHPWTWIDDQESRANSRFEIKVEDPNVPGAEAYIYVFLSSAIPDTADGYMQYTPANPGAADDIASGASYIQGHNVAGIPDRWEIPVAAGGNGTDLLDRQKARIYGLLYGFIVLDVNENILYDPDEPTMTAPEVEVVAGKVRLSRRVWYDVLGLYRFAIPYYFYPYSVDCSGASGTIKPDLINTSLIRTSFDLTSNADGMAFYNNFNSDISVDGTPDEVNTQILFKPDYNWNMFTGDQGTIVTTYTANQIGTTELYYYDNSAGGSGDGKDDTGDGESWGDTGILITGTALEGRFSSPYVTHFLPGNLAASTGPAIVANTVTPLRLSSESGVVPVELAAVEIKVIRNNAQLGWTTASESNNFGFEIHRRTNDESTWQPVRFLPGNGTVNLPRTYAWTDANLKPGTYFYRLKQIDFDGTYEFYSVGEVIISAPGTYSLAQNYPNPFNPVTKINYEIPDNTHVTLSIYNLIGERVITLVDKTQASGFYSVTWNGKNDRNQMLPSGIYLYKLNTNDYTATKQMVFIK
jgi:hypothetical protein